MVHEMKLVDFAFRAIKEKTKTIEVRLNDYKRQLIKVGDIIEFKNINTEEIIKVRVTNLYTFKTFEELFKKFSHDKLGLDDSCDASIMNNFYSEEEQEKFDVLGIEIQVI